ncbi:MAG TPA: SDR family oxidoreductase [Burkholderiaceae bacterium]
MALELNGKTALITGSTRGIGYAIAAQLMELGCRVVLNGRDEAALAAALARLPGALGFAADVTMPAQARRLVAEATEALGQLDIVVCNVGGGRSVAPGGETPEEWQRVFALNLWSATNTVEAARASLKASGGAIVCISSICGLEVIPGAPLTYAAAKAALHAYVRGIARPLGLDGVRINAIALGNILFEQSVWERKLAEDRPGVEGMLAREVALGRLGTPREAAALAAFLVSERASFATGAIWTLDGGQVHG